MNRTFRVSSFFCLTMFHQAAVPSQLAINDPTLRLKQAHLEVRCSGKIGKLGFRDQKNHHSQCKIHGVLFNASCWIFCLSLLVGSWWLRPFLAEFTGCCSPGVALCHRRAHFGWLAADPSLLLCGPTEKRRVYGETENVACLTSQMRNSRCSVYFMLIPNR